jgi:peptidoglycan/LPS O-acetylase OafA/YrhL
MPGPTIRSHPSPAAQAAQVPALTSLRFFAAWGIVVVHYSPALLLPDFPGSRALLALLGATVPLFFVLSGFVLTLRYDAPLNSPAAHPTAVRRYALARFARIAPLYWLVLLATALAYAATDHGVSLGGDAHTPGKALSFLLNALALQAWVPDTTVQQFWNAPGWSISVELFFYALLPFLLRWPVLSGTRRSVLMVIVMGWLVSIGYLGAVVPLMAIDPGWIGYGARLPLISLPSFLLGIVLARRHQLMAAKGGPLRSAALPLLGLLASALWCVQPDFPTENALLLLQVVWVPLFGWLVWCLADARRLGSRWLAAPALVLLGHASYALYLIQWLPLGFLLRGWLGEPPSPWLALALMLALLPLSIALHLGFERPVQRWLLR